MVGLHNYEYRDEKVGELCSRYLEGKVEYHPVFVHVKECKRCGKIEKSYPDVPGSNGGRFKVNYI